MYIKIFKEKGMTCQVFNSKQDETMFTNNTWWNGMNV
jgi:hypothetical protein